MSGSIELEMLQRMKRWLEGGPASLKKVEGREAGRRRRRRGSGRGNEERLQAVAPIDPESDPVHAVALPPDRRAGESARREVFQLPAEGVIDVGTVIALAGA
eukprot:1554120-Pyramimonas_sp.AAC.1